MVFPKFIGKSALRIPLEKARLVIRELLARRVLKQGAFCPSGIGIKRSRGIGGNCDWRNVEHPARDGAHVQMVHTGSIGKKILDYRIDVFEIPERLGCGWLLELRHGLIRNRKPQLQARAVRMQISEILEQPLVERTGPKRKRVGEMLSRGNSLRDLDYTVPFDIDGDCGIVRLLRA